jgi:hypothetical protein
MERKKIHASGSILAFLLITVNILAFPYILFTMYPAMGMNFAQVFRNSISTFALVSLVLGVVCLFLNSKLKPVNRLINETAAARELTQEE